MSDLYDFDAFLRRMRGLDYEDIIRNAEAEATSAEGSSFLMRGAPRRRALGSVEYASRVKAFLFYLRTGSRPGSANDSEFLSYRPIVEALVAKGRFKPEALEAFDL